MRGESVGLPGRGEAQGQASAPRAPLQPPEETHSLLTPSQREP